MRNCGGKVLAYHSWPTDLLDFPRRHADGCLSTNHSGTIREHRHAHKGEAIIVPCKGRLGIIGRLLLLFLLLVPLLHNLRVLIVDGDVDIRNLIIKGMFQLNTRNLRNPSGQLRAGKSITGKRRASIPKKPGRLANRPLSHTMLIGWKLTPVPCPESYFSQKSKHIDNPPTQAH